LSIWEDLRLTVAANNRPALLIFVEFLSAFDKMWYPVLIVNLIELDMPLTLIKWIYQWLQGRNIEKKCQNTYRGTTGISFSSDSL
jgi:hypothetical protein